MRSHCCNSIVAVECEEDGFVTRRCANCLRVLTELPPTRTFTEPKEETLREERPYVAGEDADEIEYPE